jgi:hypothetical protein
MYSAQINTINRADENNANLNAYDAMKIKESGQAGCKVSKYNYYGNKIPKTVIGSKTYWYGKYLDLLAMTDKLGVPSFFLTFTQNDNWPELQRLVQNGIKTDYNMTKHDELWHKEFMKKKLFSSNTSENVPLNEHVLKAAICFETRFKYVDKILRAPEGGPLGKVSNYWWRREYQKRGSVHIHMVVWVDDKTSIPVDAVVAEMPRTQNTENINSLSMLAQLRDAVSLNMKH